jgi:hypothetical protein
VRVAGRGYGSPRHQKRLQPLHVLERAWQHTCTSPVVYYGARMEQSWQLLLVCKRSHTTAGGAGMAGSGALRGGADMHKPPLCGWLWRMMWSNMHIIPTQ